MIVPRKRLLPLYRAGNRILDGNGKPTLLRGVNVSGMEYSRLPLAGITPDELTTIIRGWGANVVRIPFVQSRVLTDEDYRAELVQISLWLAELGAYTVLDLQWLDQERIWGPGKNRVAPQPNEQSAECWQLLAEVFYGRSHVLFDLYNEPHDIAAYDWNAWSARLASAVRSADADRLLLVSGLDWAFDLRGVDLPDEQCVYSTHVYPWKSHDWWTHFAFRAEDAPVFVAEWGGEAQHTAWGRRMAAYLKQLNLCWTAWSWRDWPHLQRNGLPTEFGEVVWKALRNP
jgi:hypothetical protein